MFPLLTLASNYTNPTKTASQIMYGLVWHDAVFGWGLKRHSSIYQLFPLTTMSCVCGCVERVWHAMCRGSCICNHNLLALWFNLFTSSIQEH